MEPKRLAQLRGLKNQAVNVILHYAEQDRSSLWDGVLEHIWHAYFAELLPWEPLAEAAAKQLGLYERIESLRQQVQASFTGRVQICVSQVEDFYFTLGMHEDRTYSSLRVSSRVLDTVTTQEQLIVACVDRLLYNFANEKYRKPQQPSRSWN